jgi:hypothetical protein
MVWIKYYYGPKAREINNEESKEAFIPREHYPILYDVSVEQNYSVVFDSIFDNH